MPLNVNSRGPPIKLTTLDNIRKSENIWDVYNHIASNVDTRREYDWLSAMDTVLLFSGLFAAFVASFITESTKKLEQDSGKILVDILLYQSRQLNNSTLPPYEAQSFKPKGLDIAVNVLFYITLGLLILVSLIATFVKSWTRNFNHVGSLMRSPMEVAQSRQAAFEKLEKYRVRWLIDAAPVLIGLALISFLLGILLQVVDLSFLVVPTATFLVLCTAFLLGPFYISLVHTHTPFETGLSRATRRIYRQPTEQDEVSDDQGMARLKKEMELGQRGLEVLLQQTPLVNENRNIIRLILLNYHLNKPETVDLLYGSIDRFFTSPSSKPASQDIQAIARLVLHKTPRDGREAANFRRSNPLTKLIHDYSTTELDYLYLHLLQGEVKEALELIQTIPTTPENANALCHLIQLDVVGESDFFSDAWFAALGHILMRFGQENSNPEYQPDPKVAATVTIRALELCEIDVLGPQWASHLPWNSTAADRPGRKALKKLMSMYALRCRTYGLQIDERLVSCTVGLALCGIFYAIPPVDIGFKQILNMDIERLDHWGPALLMAARQTPKDQLFHCLLYMTQANYQKGKSRYVADLLHIIPKFILAYDSQTMDRSMKADTIHYLTLLIEGLPALLKTHLSQLCDRLKNPWLHLHMQTILVQTTSPMFEQLDETTEILSINRGIDAILKFRIAQSLHGVNYPSIIQNPLVDWLGMVPTLRTSWALPLFFNSEAITEPKVRHVVEKLIQAQPTNFVPGWSALIKMFIQKTPPVPVKTLTTFASILVELVPDETGTLHTRLLVWLEKLMQTLTRPFNAKLFYMDLKTDMEEHRQYPMPNVIDDWGFKWEQEKVVIPILRDLIMRIFKESDRAEEYNQLFGDPDTNTSRSPGVQSSTLPLYPFLKDMLDRT